MHQRCPRRDALSITRHDPFALFTAWRSHAHDVRGLRHPDAVCVATVDEAGVPSARFVDLKAVTDRGFVFCTHLLSPKALHLARNPHLALTFWWDHVGRQVRVVGRATRIPDAEADEFFRARPRDAQIASWCDVPGRMQVSDEAAAERAKSVRQRFDGVDVSRPPDWGGFRVAPVQIEFLAFREDRMHERVLYERIEEEWTCSRIQP